MAEPVGAVLSFTDNPIIFKAGSVYKIKEFKKQFSPEKSFEYPFFSLEGMRGLTLYTNPIGFRVMVRDGGGRNVIEGREDLKAAFANTESDTARPDDTRLILHRDLAEYIFGDEWVFSIPFALDPIGTSFDEPSIYSLDFPLAAPFWLFDDKERETVFRNASTTLLVKQFLYIGRTGLDMGIAFGTSLCLFVDLNADNPQGSAMFVNLFDASNHRAPKLNIQTFASYIEELSFIWAEQEQERDIPSDMSYLPSEILMTISNEFGDSLDVEYVMALLSAFDDRIQTLVTVVEPSV